VISREEAQKRRREGKEREIRIPSIEEMKDKCGNEQKRKERKRKEETREEKCDTETYSSGI
jgi:hypothetical protein